MTTTTMSDQDSIIVRKIAESAGKFSLEVTDVAASIETVSHRLSEQNDSLRALDEAARDMAGSNGQILEATAAARAAGSAARGQIDDSRARLDQALQSIGFLIDLADSIVNVAAGLEKALEKVDEATSRISAISRQTNLLALNAKIEATRAGDMGAGFAVVAQEVKTLSSQTGTATTDISDTIGNLAARLKDLSAHAESGRRRADDARQAADSIRQTYEVVESSVLSMEAQSNGIAEFAKDVSDRCDGVVTRISTLVDGVRSCDRNLKEASHRIDAVLQVSEDVIGLSGQFSTATVDTPMINLVRSEAQSIGAALEQHIARGAISRDGLFSDDYRPIAASNPQQFTSPSLPILEAVGHPIVAAIAATDPRIVSAGIFDRNGYLPATTKESSQPQGPDPKWNDAHCRNKRKYSNRVAVRACASDAPFLLQCYLREMNGSKQLLKDVSAPIQVDGRKWGVLRIIYKSESQAT